MKITPDIRIIKLPKCKVATSGFDWFDKTLMDFPKWWSEYNQKRCAVSLSPFDFMWYDGGQPGKAVWWNAVENDATIDDCGGYDIIDFEGGLYAVAAAVDGDDKGNGIIINEIMKWLETSGFELDIRANHEIMWQMINTDDIIKKTLGYLQLDIFVPIKIRI